MTRRFLQIDVFGDGLCAGNPLAVVVDAEGLETESMARFSSWTNLSEASFLLPPDHPDADYRVRIDCSDDGTVWVGGTTSTVVRGTVGL